VTDEEDDDATTTSRERVARRPGSKSGSRDYLDFEGNVFTSGVEPVIPAYQGVVHNFRRKFPVSDFFLLGRGVDFLTTQGHDGAHSTESIKKVPFGSQYIQPSFMYTPGFFLVLPDYFLQVPYRTSFSSTEFS